MSGQSTRKEEDTRRTKQWLSDGLFCLVCGMVVGLFTWFTAISAPLETIHSRVDQENYNLLAQGFSAGQLNIRKGAPPELAKLSDPYDPNINAPYIGAVNDLSYYKGKLYLYFGVTPALVFFWPYYALTGHFLSEKEEVVFFIGIGFGAIAGLLRAMRRRYFPDTSLWLVVAGAIGPGLALALTLSANVYENAIVCGFAFSMLALAALWAALHNQGKHRVVWLALSSLAYGLAIGARPTLLFGAVILLLPLMQAWHEADGSRLRRISSLFMAATAPVTLAGLGLLLYNALRFDNPFEFGWHYQLNTGYRPTSAGQFSLHYFWFNIRLYFLEPVLWSGRFPFVKVASLPPPAGYDTGSADTSGGILFCYPMVLFILAAPLVWKHRPQGTTSGLEWFEAACFLLFMTGATVLALFFASGARYELDFLPGLLLLSIVGFYGALRFSAWRRLAIFGWCLFMGFSIAFNFFINIESHAENHYLLGNFFFSAGRPAEARAEYQKALALFPECADAHGGLGNFLVSQGHLDEAIVEYQKALEFDPNCVEAQNNIGYCFLKLGRLDDAITHYETVVKLRPGTMNYRIALGTAYSKKGIWDEAIIQYKCATEIEPGDADAYNDLGNALCANGKFDDAIEQYQKAIAIQPGTAEVHEHFGDALFRKGDLGGATIQYQIAVKLKPDFANAHNSLGYCYQQAGRENEAIIQYQKAIELEPGFVQAYNNLGNTYRQMKSAAQAVASYQKAADLAPQFVAAQLNLAWLLATWPDPGVRNGDKAVALATRLNDRTQDKNPEILRTLAAAYAETGKFAEAISTANQALTLAQAESRTELSAGLQTEIRLYQANTPCRSTGNF